MAARKKEPRAPAPSEPTHAQAHVEPQVTGRAGRVAIVGRPNVGKSTLLNALLGETIAITSHHPQTTRDRIAGIVTHGDAQIVFVDTPGVHKARTKLGARMNQEAREGARDADVVVFMTDVAPTPRASLSEEDARILAAIPDGKPVLLVVNKVDRVIPKAALFPALEAYSKAREFVAVVPLSAKKRDNVAPLLDEVAKLLPEGPPLFEDDSLTDKPVRFLVAEFVREQVLRKTREEVPHGVAVVVERYEEDKIPKIDLAVHVDKESHKRIVIGAGGALMKEIGSLARKKVEQLLGTQVTLRIWVRVTPGWYEKDNLFRDLGYEPPTATEKD